MSDESTPTQETQPKKGDPVEIPVYFMDNDPVMVRFFKAGLSKWETVCNIKYPITGIQSHSICRVTFHPHKGHWSYVGTDNLRVNPDLPTLNLAFNQRGVNLHEIGHLSGFSHAQSNPNNPVPWDLPKVYAKYKIWQNWTEEETYNNVIKLLDKEKIIATNRDSESLMHYAVDNALTIGDYEVGWNYDFSSGDLAFMPFIYPFKEPEKTEDFDIIGLFLELYPSQKYICGYKRTLVAVANRLGITYTGNRKRLRSAIWEVLKAHE